MARRVLFAGLFALFLSGCAGQQAPREEISPRPQLRQVSFGDLPGWRQDDMRPALQAFLSSCSKLLQQPAQKSFHPAGTYGDFHAACRMARTVATSDSAAILKFFETTFLPYQVTDQTNGESQGLFTGYYEASLRGARTRHGPYQTPLYEIPQDLVTADLGEWYDDLAGRKITAQVREGKLQRYPDRARIEAEGLPAAKPIVWVDDPADAFFLHIQGSGVVALENGQTLRVGFAGKNGHDYYAVGRALIERGALTKETVSLQTIRSWMEAHPLQAQALMNLNPSYVFFRILTESGPVGAQGVVLTPGRSLAVDKTIYDYGMPVWLQAAHPQTDQKEITRLMIAQDTGGAIRGVVRGDFFWGYGAAAERAAGEMKSPGRFWILLPKKTML
ncbi:MAG: murein transglycosylase A [Rhodospirillales bacterium]|nr:murein transglycosylase A [Rhodospirillales bacterium]MCB9964831.1 murein transglycosylase A [Rhodospirillales bacterium]